MRSAKLILCRLCEGDGHLYDYVACNVCGGYHQHDWDRENRVCEEDVNRRDNRTCPRCDGSGYDTQGGTSEGSHNQVVFF